MNSTQLSQIADGVRSCASCSLAGKHGIPVPPWWADDELEVMLIGEQPGKEEADPESGGIPFIGNAGRYLNELLEIAGLGRTGVLLTNTINCLSSATGSGTPPEEAVSICTTLWLVDEIRAMRPKLIIPVGAAAIRWVLNDPTLTVSQTHGLPKEVMVAGHRTVVFPCYHPAAGLRQARFRKLVMDDFKALGAFLADGLRFSRDNSRPDLVTIRVSVDTVVEAISQSPSVAVDTESDERGLFCMSFSTDGRTGYVVHRDDLGADGAKRLTEALNRPGLVVVMHNALYDVRVLESVSIKVDKTVFDSMIAAYLLGKESQALKELAYRDLGLKMARYDDLVGQYGAEKVKRYLLEAAKHKYGPMPPEDRWEWNKGKTDILLKTHKHQPLERKLGSMAKKVGQGADGFKLVGNLEAVEREAIERATGLTVPHPTIADVPTEAKWVRYSAMDAIATHQLRPVLERQIKHWDMGSLLWDIELPLVPILNRMTAQGLYWDRVENERIAKEMAEKLEDALGQVWWEAGTPFNVSSPQQVAWLLFDRLGLKPTKRTPTGGISTDDDVLEELKGRHPVVDAIMEHREIEKLKGTYIDVYPRIVHPDGRIRTTYKQTRTATGRLSSEAPNVQNVPVEGYGLVVRRVFTAPSWDWVLLSVDASQIEMRCMAHLSQDPVMLRAFREGRDLHAETATYMYEKLAQQITPDERKAAKRVNFGVIYGISAMGLYKQDRNIGVEDWQGHLNTWFETYQGVRAYMKTKEAEILERGWVKDMFNRVRWVPEAYSPIRKERAEGIRMAVNMPVQGTAADILKIAMIRIDWALQKARLQGRMILQVHDELVFECPAWEVEELAGLVVPIMESAVKLDVPTPCDAKVGYRWGEMEKLDWR